VLQEIISMLPPEQSGSDAPSAVHRVATALRTCCSMVHVQLEKEGAAILSPLNMTLQQDLVQQLHHLSTLLAPGIKDNNTCLVQAQALLHELTTACDEQATTMADAQAALQEEECAAFARMRECILDAAPSS
jgi:hypothetical protein